MLLDLNRIRWCCILLYFELVVQRMCIDDDIEVKASNVIARALESN
jgi:hypothetical protein